jgi:hypothetical protein
MAYFLLFSYVTVHMTPCVSNRATGCVPLRLFKTFLSVNGNHQLAPPFPHHCLCRMSVVQWNGFVVPLKMFSREVVMVVVMVVVAMMVEMEAGASMMTMMQIVENFHNHVA